MVDFAGWSMPIQYRSILEEHRATRNEVTLFDVSHMGRFEIEGADAESFLDHMATRKVRGMRAGQIRYSLLCNNEGGIRDDVLIYRLEGEGENSKFQMVVNAGNREKIWGWLGEHSASYSDVRLQDRTLQTAMIAVQGPEAISVVGQHLFADVESLKLFNGQYVNCFGHECFLSRTGYTGEDGVELILDAEHATAVWPQLIQLGAEAAGLGARDTLRLEAAMPLYGHELSETVNAAQTDLRFAISLKDREFVGKTAIEKEFNDPSLPVRVGLELAGRRAAREKSEVYVGDEKIGVVTSGTYSPTLEKSIAMAYVSQEFAGTDQAVSVDIRGKRLDANIVSLPFYKRK